MANGTVRIGCEAADWKQMSLLNDAVEMPSLRHLIANGVRCKPGVAGKDLIAMLLDDPTNAIRFDHDPSYLRRHQIDDDSDPAAEAKTTDATRGPE
jgi:hypothetical protein